MALLKGAAENDRKHLWCIRHEDLDMGAMGYKYPMVNKESYLTNKQTHGIMLEGS